MGLIVKIGKIASLDDARMAASLGVPYLGFVVGNSPNCISPIQLPDILTWVPESTPVIESENYSLAEINSLSSLLGVNHFEIATQEDPEQNDLTLFGRGFLPKGPKDQRWAILSVKDADNQPLAKRVLVTISLSTSRDELKRWAEHGVAGFNLDFDSDWDYDALEELLEVISSLSTASQTS